MQNNIENANLCQDLKVNNDSDANFIESGDSIEIETLVTVFKENKLTDVIENTQQKSFKLKLGKNKLAKRIEDSILNMKQGERKLFVLTGSMMAPFYSNLISSNTIIFYDINILKVVIIFYHFGIFFKFNVSFLIRLKRMKKKKEPFRMLLIIVH